MKVKAINYFDKDFDYDDFIISGEIYIGPEDEDFVYDVFEFNVISIKRLYTNFENETGNPVMLNRGWIIVKEFDENLIAKEIELIKKLNGGAYGTIEKSYARCVHMIFRIFRLCN